MIFQKSFSWINKNELWYWKRLLRVPWTTRRSNQSILKEINPEYSLEGLMLKLKLQYFGHLMRRADTLEKSLMLGKNKGRKTGNRGWDGWMEHWLKGHEFEQTRRWWRTGKPGVLQSMGFQWVRHDLVTKQQPIWGQRLWISSRLVSRVPAPLQQHSLARAEQTQSWL